ncbi:MAG: DUF4129 domain-containing protein [Thermodesulfobacteriota bacterium]
MSERGGHALFFLFRSGAEGLWVIASAGFTVSVTVGRPFPVLSGIATFLAAAALTRALSGRGMRRIAVLAIHLLGLLACLCWGLGGFLPGRALIPAHGDWMAWGWTIQTAFWIGVLWMKGAALSRNPGTHERICSQFDKGVGWFGLVFLVSFLVEVKGGLPASWAGTFPLFFLFFVMGIAAMGLSGPAEQPGTNAEGAPGAGLVLAFAVLVAGVGTGTILLLMPILMHGAEMGAEALKTTTSPIGPVLVDILRFLFGRRRMSARGEVPPEAGGTASPLEGGEAASTVLQWAFGWFLAVVLGLLLTGMLVILLLYLVKALLSRTRPDYAKTLRLFTILDRFIQWLDHIRGISATRMVRSLRDPGPVRLFNRLSVWGRRSGLPRSSTDTPMEYGLRLSNHFKGLSGDILLLVDLVNRELYADLRPGPDHRSEGIDAWRRLRSPRHWYVRLRALFRPVDSL